MKSRVNREVHARICEGLGVKLPGATRPSGTAQDVTTETLLCGVAYTPSRLLFAAFERPRLRMPQYDLYFGGEQFL